MERLNKILISPNITIRQALKQMDMAGEKILFVVNSDNVIRGVVTDGNIRRWILKGGRLTEPISKAMHKDPIVLREPYSKDEARDLMLAKSVECMPIVNKEKKIMSAIWWLDLFEKKISRHGSINIPIILMAGGEGSRLSPFTKILPKPLMLMGEKPIVELIIDRFTESGCRDFYLSVNYKSHIIKAFFSDFEHDYRIHYIQESKPLGTAGSLHMLKGKLNKTFCVTNCDILIDANFEDVLRFHRTNGNKITLVGSMKHYTIPYGVCKVGNKGTLKKIEEKPEYDFLVNTGMYLLEPDILDLIPKDRIYHMTDLINDYMKKGKAIGVYPISEKSWIDIGQWEELKDALKRFGAWDG